MAVQNSVRSFIGIAKEVTKGTAVAPTDYLLVQADSLKPADIIDPLFDNGLRGSLVENYNYIPGRTRSTFDFSSSAFPDGIGYALTGLLGSVATTGASAPFTHTISLKNNLTAAADAQPLSYTLTDFYAAAVRAYPGVQFTDFTLKPLAGLAGSPGRKPGRWSRVAASTAGSTLPESHFSWRP